MILVPLDAASQTARPTRNAHPETPMSHPEIYIENQNIVRFDSGGLNYAGKPNQHYVCSFDELMSREGNCSTIPVDPIRGTAVFTTHVGKGIVGNKPTCVAGSGTGMCEYITEWGIWRFNSGELAKSTISPDRLDWIKSTPSQGAAKALVATNSAPGDMMAHAIQVIDLAGARSGGDEGDMLIRGGFRDWSSTSRGWIPDNIQIQIPENRSHVQFSPIIKGNRQLHWNVIGPDRMIIFPEVDSIPITISKEGWNPKPGYVGGVRPEGGAIWKLETPLPRLLKSRNQPNGIPRTDYCLTMDATEYNTVGGKEKHYLQVAETPDEHTVITNYVRKGGNSGMPSQYINGYESIDTAVNKGINHGELVPCSVLRSISFPDTDIPNTAEDRVYFKLNNVNTSAIQEGAFEIEPMTEVEIPYLTEYKIPASGMYSLQAYTVVIDQRLGSAGEVSAYMAHTSGQPDSRAANMGMFIGGNVPQTRKDAGFPYSFKTGIELRDTRTPLVILNSSGTGNKKPIAVLGAQNSSYINHSQINYIQPTDGTSEAVFNTPVGKDNYVVMVRVGDGEPNPKTCTRPGLERYYQLDTNTEWICNSEKEFFVPSRPTTTTTSCELTECEKADINGDGVVGGPDFVFFVSNFGSVCSAQ